MPKCNSQFFTTYFQTITWLENIGIKNYFINPDNLQVDVHTDVRLADQDLKTIPVKFNRVRGNFDCHLNQLESLIGAPNVVDDNFWCDQNQLTSLIGSPFFVGLDYLCHNNKLTSLKGAPNSIYADFWCYGNQLTSLKGAPLHIGQNFKFDCDSTILHNINKFIKSANSITMMRNSPDIRGIMRIFLIKNLQSIKINAPSVEQILAIKIINKHLCSDRSGPACQIELIDAGLSKFISI